MKFNENTRHIILLVAVSLMLIIFVTGLAVDSEIPVSDTVIDTF